MKFKSISFVVLLGASTLVIAAPQLIKQNTLTILSHITTFYNIPDFPDPSSSTQIANLQVNPQNYVDSTITIPMNDTDFDVYTNNNSNPIVMVQSGTPELKADSPLNTQTIGFNILYTPCGQGSTTININSQCTNSGCAIPNNQTKPSSCMGGNGAAHGNIQYVLKTPTNVLANGLYAVSPDYLITFQAGF